MRRFVALAVLMFGVVIASTAYGGSVNLAWMQYGPTAGVESGTDIDTVFFSVGSTAVIDTTQTFSFPAGQYPRVFRADLMNQIGTIHIPVSGTFVSTDSIFVATDVSWVAGRWHEGSFVGTLVNTTGSAMSASIIADPVVDTDHQVLLSSSGKFRFRIRADGNSAAKMSNVGHVYFTWQNEPGLREHIKQIKWEQYGPTAGQGNGTLVDTVFFNGATQVVDTTTTFAFPTNQAPEVVVGAVSSRLRGGLHLISTDDAGGLVDGFVSTDSIAVAVDRSMDGTNWTTSVYQARLTNPAAGGHAFYPIIFQPGLGDLDGQASVLAGENLRFRVNGAYGNTAGRSAGSRLFLVWYSRK